MFTSTPRTGDWVVTTDTVPDGTVFGSNIDQGTHGVILATHPHWWSPTATVRFDRSLTITDRRVPITKLRVVRRGGGIDTFDRRTNWIHVIRISVIVALLVPTLVVVVVYWWTNRTLNGLIEYLALSAIDNTVAFIDYALTNPPRALLFLLAGWAITKFAFR